jgi:hypothetical protein
MSQMKCKLSNFTLSKLTFHIGSVDQPLEKQYVLNLADSTEIKINADEQIVKIKKLDENLCNFTFRCKLSEKFAFVEDYSNKEIYIQDLTDFKKIVKIKNNQNAFTNLNIEETNIHKTNMNQFDLNTITNEIIEDKQNLDEPLSADLIIQREETKNNYNILIAAQENNSIYENNLNFPNKISDENLKEAESLISHNEKPEKKTIQDLPKSKTKTIEENVIKNSASWNNFMEYVKSNVIYINTGNQTSQDIMLNKEKLLNEIMNDPMCEEVYLEESPLRCEGNPRIFLKETSNLNESAIEILAENKPFNPINEEKLENNLSLKINNDKDENENYLTQITGKLEEQYALGSQVIKDYNTQYVTLCLMTANKSYEIPINEVETLSKIEGISPDIIEQQRQIDELIQQAISDNEKLKNKYMNLNKSEEAALQISNNNDNSKSIKIEIINEKIQFIKPTEEDLNVDINNYFNKDLHLKEASNEEQKKNENFSEILLFGKEEETKKVDSDNYMSNYTKEIQNEENKANLTVKNHLKNSNPVENEITNLENNKDNNDLKNKNLEIVYLSSNQNKIDTSPKFNDNNLVEDNLYQKKYPPIDVEEFLKTLFSIQNNK